jgi:hypothetical protein
MIMDITPEKLFAIYQTPKGIELHNHQVDLAQAKLICVVSHRESAIRIARQAAQTYQVPLVK